MSPRIDEITNITRKLRATQIDSLIFTRQAFTRQQLLKQQPFMQHKKNRLRQDAVLGSPFDAKKKTHRRWMRLVNIKMEACEISSGLVDHDANSRKLRNFEGNNKADEKIKLGTITVRSSSSKRWSKTPKTLGTTTTDLNPIQSSFGWLEVALTENDPKKYLYTKKEHYRRSKKRQHGVVLDDFRKKKSTFAWGNIFSSWVTLKQTHWH